MINSDLIVNDKENAVNNNRSKKRVLSPKANLSSKRATVDAAKSTMKRLQARKKRACEILEEQVLKLKHDRISQPTGAAVLAISKQGTDLDLFESEG